MQTAAHLLIFSTPVRKLSKCSRRARNISYFLKARDICKIVDQFEINLPAIIIVEMFPEDGVQTFLLTGEEYKNKIKMYYPAFVHYTLPRYLILEGGEGQWFLVFP